MAIGHRLFIRLRRLPRYFLAFAVSACFATTNALNLS